MNLGIYMQSGWEIRFKFAKLTYSWIGYVDPATVEYCHSAPEGMLFLSRYPGGHTI